MALFGHYKQKPLFPDPFFGELRFYEAKTGNFFSGSRAFAPTGGAIDLLIEAEEEGPGEEQRAFFREVEQRYAELKEAAGPLLEDLFGDAIDGFAIRDFDAEFTPVHLRIPRPEPLPRQWELTFTSTHDDRHQFTVLFSEWKATNVQVDG